MKTVTSNTMRELDRKTIEEYGVPAEVLMDRAGMAVAEAVKKIADARGFPCCRVRLIAGKGNNGGDAFAAASYLAAWGFSPSVWLDCSQSRLAGESLNHFRKMKNIGVPFCELEKASDWKQAATPVLPADDILVDGLLGTGISGPARGIAEHAIRYVNRCAKKCPVVAIDIPSGLNADTGEAAGEAVQADLTVTMGLPKKGLIEPAALNYVGGVRVADIGIPGELVSELESSEELITVQELSAMLKPRNRDAHKGRFGHALLIGGARGYTGAVSMSAKALVRSGAGLLSVVVPESMVPVVATCVPEAMVHGCEENDRGGISAQGLQRWLERLPEFDTVVAGSGMMNTQDTADAIELILNARKGSLVLDADGINVCEHRTQLLAESNAEIVVTPHPGEMARLRGCTARDIQEDRIGSAGETADRLGVTVVLKGAGSIVAQEGRQPAVNMTGNPGMATGGSGDVLSGILGGLLAQGMNTYDAASMAVYVHGRAGELAAWRLSQLSMIPGDMTELLPHAFRELAPR
jgi:NAD(P)H-hydrate epimerase